MLWLFQLFNQQFSTYKWSEGSLNDFVCNVRLRVTYQYYLPDVVWKFRMVGGKDRLNSMVARNVVRIFVCQVDIFVSQLTVVELLHLN